MAPMEDIDKIRNALEELDFSAFPKSRLYLGSAGVWLAIDGEAQTVHGLDPEGNVQSIPYPSAADLVV